VVVTFHDAIAEHFSRLVMPSLRGRLFWNLKTRLARASAREIVTVSQSAREEIHTYLGVPKDQISVVFEAAETHFVPVTDVIELAAMRQALKLPPGRRRILYVGGIAPHKNLLGLLEGFARIVSKPGCNDIDLVVAGDPKGDGFHSNTQQLYARAADPALVGRVHFTGFVPDKLLPALYSDAFAVAMPAFSEGFGLPAAEAIACGTPVIATRDGAVAEVVLEAGLFFDPRDPDDIARVIWSLATDPALAERLRAACLPRAKQMSWEGSALAMLDLLERCAEPG
jgi:glycosyltransferase involved in cell wall biosynthesis